MIAKREFLEMNIEVIKYKLNFKFEAGTSRGVLHAKDSWFVKLYEAKKKETFGIGECGPLPGLSPDLDHDIEQLFHKISLAISNLDELSYDEVCRLVPSHFPAVRFALETALIDLRNGCKRMISDNEFARSNSSIPINGLVWMGDKELMINRIKSKIDEGFDCIKIKVGAINFEDELALLQYIRTHFNSKQVTIRLDANGAFKPERALEKLEQLSAYDIHSIEQPIMQGNRETMRKLCVESPIPIALDEELIGVEDASSKAELLDQIMPAYIILKPTLVGGLSASAEWIDLAESKGIGWWITSALESNIGLNAIAQFTADYPIDMAQGLGTGQLFHNNIPSPLSIKRGKLFYGGQSQWDLSILD